MYGLTEEEIGIARSVGADPFFLVQEKNRGRIETYYSKNPALVQREVSDIDIATPLPPRSRERRPCLRGIRKAARYLR